MTINHTDKRCEGCGQLMKPKGVRKKPNEWDHAQGCPYEMSKKERELRQAVAVTHSIGTQDEYQDAVEELRQYLATQVKPKS